MEADSTDWVRRVPTEKRTQNPLCCHPELPLCGGPRKAVCCLISFFSLWWQGKWPSSTITATLAELTAAAGREFAPVEAEVRAAAKARPRLRMPPGLKGRLYTEQAVYI